ncbi:hypothetical protein [Pyxidicoccus caerfyrddinensis]|jgi:hypothetical protein|uniref:hypothetical protein n=1 Tax=Pyxidicoccus caerfyrddinensis TaxID=2709663 RepID=UPI001F081849|nr:hypothetical protein [Pyxidicoccus caerfyrddinensis]
MLLGTTLRLGPGLAARRGLARSILGGLASLDTLLTGGGLSSVLLATLGLTALGALLTGGRLT